jgi:hypothetical protein
VLDLLAPEAQWSFVREHLSGIQFYIDMIDRATPEQLGQLVRLLRQQGYQVSVECGGTLDFAPMDETNGEVSARIELAKLAKFYAAGGRADFLNLDGPVRRLMHPHKRRDGRRFESVEKAADELVDYLNLVRRAHPELRFFLTNFPNWGYRGAVSTARGPQQDYGDYDTVVRVVLDKLKAANIPLAGVTVDNPYDYLVGEHSSVNLKDPRTVDWLGRVRAYEDFARAQGLQFNLIVNSERGGHASAETFYADTLKMVETYRKAGGQPTRWFVQSWYPHPTQIVPETAPHSLTALAKAVIEAVGSGVAPSKRGEARDTARTPVDHGPVRRPGAASGDRIVLQPQPGTMTVTAKVPGLSNQVFSLGIPETIGCQEAMLLNFPEATIRWAGPDAQGVVSCSWGPGGRIYYSVRMIPAATTSMSDDGPNHTEFLWHKVFAFNCLNPTGAPDFKDWTLERTYMSSQGRPLCLARAQRVRGHMPTVGFYLPERVEAGRESVFVRGFGATSPNRTDGSWIVTQSQPKGSYMAAAVVDAAFLFDNLGRCCIHAADSGYRSRATGTTVSRSIAQGSLELPRTVRADRPGLATRRRPPPANRPRTADRSGTRARQFPPNEQATG